MDSKKEIQHVYLVGAKSLGAYGGYETFVYKLTEYHQNKENIKYHVACKANGDGCMDESKFEGVTKINDHEFEFHNAHCFKIDVPQIGSAQAIYYDVAALKACCEHMDGGKEKSKGKLTMSKYFGTDGFRGEAGITLTADHAYKVGRFLGWYYNALRERNGDTDPARIVIGKDTRRSSYMFEYSLVAGLTASGADAYLLHVTTTPSVAYIARVDDFDCGIMISASHNPYYDNGIKLIDCYGEKMPEETLLLVEDYIDGKLHVFDKDWPELPFAHREHIGCTVDYVAGRNRYMGYLISMGIYSFKGVKVGLDCANGSSWNIAKSVFDALGADTYVINVVNRGMQEKQSITVRCVDIEDLEKQAEAIRVEQIKLYESYADGVLLRDAYIEKKKVLSEKLAALQDSIRTEKEEQECADELDEEIRALTKQASEKTYIGGLTKECVDAFVSMVYLYDDQTMKIEFNCEDVIRRALEKYGA